MDYANLLTWHKENDNFVKTAKVVNISLYKSKDACGCSLILLFELHFKILYFYLIICIYHCILNPNRPATHQLSSNDLWMCEYCDWTLCVVNVKVFLLRWVMWLKWWRTRPFPVTWFFCSPVEKTALVLSPQPAWMENPTIKWAFAPFTQ